MLTVVVGQESLCRWRYEEQATCQMLHLRQWSVGKMINCLWSWDVICGVLIELLQFVVIDVGIDVWIVVLVLVGVRWARRTASMLSEKIVFRFSIFKQGDGLGYFCICCEYGAKFNRCFFLSSFQYFDGVGVRSTHCIHEVKQRLKRY